MRRGNENKEMSLKLLYIDIKKRSLRQEVKKKRMRRESSEDKGRDEKRKNYRAKLELENKIG